MNTQLSTESFILNTTGASSIGSTESLQTLWSGYGDLIRYNLDYSTEPPNNTPNPPSVILKHIQPPEAHQHPRGWNTDISHQRKLRSYAIESAFYQNYADECDQYCRIPSPLAIQEHGLAVQILLEDLDASGFSRRITQATPNNMRACLTWLAYFHARFMHRTPDQLWPIGTYWHLDTRPDELAALSDLPLKQVAHKIDAALNQCDYKTFVHGDAKLANFCFSEEGEQVAAVDFQYVGGGCGMKDVAYFIGSCLYDDECEQQTESLLCFYFKQLEKALAHYDCEVDASDVEQQWRALFPIAWADFHRFIKGWSPSHRKIHSYSERISREVIRQFSANETR